MKCMSCEYCLLQRMPILMATRAAVDCNCHCDYNKSVFLLNYDHLYTVKIGDVLSVGDGDGTSFSYCFVDIVVSECILRGKIRCA